MRILPFMAGATLCAIASCSFFKTSLLEDHFSTLSYAHEEKKNNDFLKDLQEVYEKQRLEHLKDNVKEPELKDAYKNKTEKVANKRAVNGVSKKELEMMAYTVEQEARGLSLRHKELVAGVIVNRLKHSRFHYSNIKQVVSAKRQFDGYSNYISRRNKPNNDTWLACERAINGEVNIDPNVLFFYNPKIAGRISWFERQKLVYQIDGHRFFAVR